MKGQQYVTSKGAPGRGSTLRNHLYPFYERLAHYRDDLEGWAGKHMILGQTVPFENFTVAVYTRPTETKPDPLVEHTPYRDWIIPPEQIFDRLIGRPQGVGPTTLWLCS